jgi:stage V sporulation protein D (sporulation-specific penicillin-binding protein)
VLDGETASVLRALLARVVSEGTGTAAFDPLLPAAGKTGTAQKSRDGRGYTPGCYVATFAGFVPVEAPRLVIVAVLDEPQPRFHYAAQSAVPLFAAVVREVVRRTTWLDGATVGTAVAARRSGGDAIPVPDVLYADAEQAARRLETAGFQVSGAELGGIVIEQVPAAGSLCRRGSEIALTLAAAHLRAAGASCPDLLGLSDRQVRGLAARLGLPLTVAGSGYVVEQFPAAGSQLPATGVRVRLAW